MTELKMTRLAQKKKISVSTVSRVEKSKTFQETPLKCCNDSETSGEEHPPVE